MISGYAISEVPLSFAYYSTNTYELVTITSSPALIAVINDWNLNSTIEQPTLVANINVGEVFTFSQVIAQPSISAIVTRGQIYTFNSTMHRLKLDASIIGQDFYTFSNVINNITLSGSISSDAIYRLTTTLRKPVVTAYWTNDVFVYTVHPPGGDTSTPDVKTYVVNTLNTGHSEYTNHEFNSYFKLANSYYGINKSGVFKLTGDLDDTIPITAQVDTPVSSFDKQGLKACTDAIILGRLQGDMEVITVNDEQEQREGFIVTQDLREGLHRIRVKIPKGLKGSTWQYKIKNIDGCQFSINNFEVFLKELQRIR